MIFKNYIVMIFITLPLTSCSNDPLDIGVHPTPPKDNIALAGQPGTRPETLTPRVMPDPLESSYVSNSGRGLKGLVPPLNPLPAGLSFIPVMITSTWGLGAQVTVWALPENNWLWGYSPAKSGTFGEATQWYASRQKDGTVVFVNALPKGSKGTGTCMEPYNNGVVHSTCGVESPKSSQRWQLLPVENGGMLIVNSDNQKCLRLATRNTQYAWNVTLEGCNKSPGAIVDKTFIWNLTPWPVFAQLRG